MTGQAARTGGGLKVRGKANTEAGSRNIWRNGASLLVAVLLLFAFAEASMANTCSTDPDDWEAAWVDSKSGAGSEGFTLHTRVKNCPNCEIRRSYIKATVPEYVDSVILHMTAKDGHPKPAYTTVDVRAVSSNWSAGSLTWGNAPTGFGAFLGTLDGTGSVDVTGGVVNGVLSVALLISDETGGCNDDDDDCDDDDDDDCGCEELHIDWIDGYIEFRYDCCSVYEIAFVNSSYNGSTTTFTYTVTSHSSPAISHWVLGVPGCITADDIVSASPSPWSFGTDPTTGVYGLKFDSGVPEGSTITFTVTLDGYWPEGTTATDSAIKAASKAGTQICTYPTTGPACRFADLELTKEVDEASPIMGSEVTYTITLHNNGPSAATGVEVTDLLPSGLDYVSDLPSQGAYSDASGIWAVGTISSGGSGTLRITATVLGSGNYENTAEVTDSDVPDPDSTPNNHDPSEDDQDSVIITPTANPVILVEKSGPGTANVGDIANYSVSVQHDPASDGSPVNITAVTDSLGIALSLSSGDDGNGLLEAGEIWIYTGSREVLPTDPTSLVNEACVYGEDLEGDPVEDCDSTTTIIDHNPALLVLKSGLPATASVGDIVNYTITVQHHASSDGSPIDITDVNDSLGIVLSGPTGDDGEGLLENGETWIYTGSRVVLSEDPRELVNTVCVTGDDLDGDELSDCDSTTTTVEHNPCILLEKTGPESACIGNEVTYHFRVENCGDIVLHTGAHVYDPLINPDGDHEIWSGILQPGDIVEFDRTYTIQPGDPAPLVNTATAIGHPPGYSAVEDTATWTINIGGADLVVTKTDDSDPVASGELLTYTITVTNDGPCDATGVIATDTLPGGTSYHDHSVTKGAYSNGIWSIGNLDFNESATLNLIVRVDSGTTGTITNTVCVESTTYDPDTSDNCAEEQTTVVDGYVTITPAEAVNQVGDPHIFVITAHAKGGVPTDWDLTAYDVTPSPSSETLTGPVVAGDGLSATWELEIDSTDPDVFSASASVDISFGSTVVSVSTDGIGENSDPGEKTYIDVRLSLTPESATNQIGDNHVFTATLEYTTNGTTWFPLSGKTIDFEITSGVGALSSPSATTNPSGEATVTLSSTSVGSTAVEASFDGVAAGADATADDTADKDWIDVRLSLTPESDTNQIGDDHVFTATLEYNDGSGWLPLVGKTISFTKTGVGSLSSPTATTNPSGEATVTLSSTSAGSTAVEASFDGVAAGADATADDTADKDWIDVRLSLTPEFATNQIGDNHVFTATLEYTTNGTTWFPLSGKTIDFEITSGVGALSSPSATTNPSGEATVTLSSTSVGSTAVEASFDGVAAGADATADDTADKDWIDVRLSLTPESDTNQIGDDHVFTATLEYNDGSGWLPLVGKTISFTKTGVGSLSSPTATTDANGEATVTLSSTSVGSTAVEASFDGVAAGADATADDSADKDWIDVRLSLTPESDTNQIGDEHVFTATLEYNDGSGWLPLVGKTISFTKTGVGSLSSPTATTDANGEATVTLTSDSIGSTAVEASFDGIAAGADATADDSADKDWIDVRMTFGPDGATNAIGDEHTFVTTLEYTTDGTAWLPLDGKTILVTITSGPGVLGAGPYVTDANGEVDVTLNSDVAGVTIVTASWNGTVLGTSASASDPSDKTWVDARMSFGPDGATNAIGDEHTFAAHLEINDGTGWQDAAGETITVTITSGPGVLGAGPYVTDANGEVDVTLNSDVAGVTIVTASWNGTVLGTSVSASDPSDKTWVEVGARMTLTPDGATNEVDDPHVLTAHLEIYDGTSWQDAAGETITISITSGPGTLSLGPYVTDANGEVDVTLNSDVPGVVIVEASWSGAVLTFPVSASDTADKTYVDAYVTITPGEAVNEVGDPHTFTITAYAQGAIPTSWNLVLYNVVPAPASESLTGPAIAGDGMSASWQLTINNPDPGVFSASASVDVSFGATVVSISTDSTGSNSAPAGKTYVDARMSFGPDGATNAIGDEHTFAAHLEINDGTGWQDAAGETITVTITSGPGVLGAGPYVTDANGEVDVTLNSDVAGVTIVTASWNGTVLGTSASASDPSDKTWLIPELTIDKTGDEGPVRVGETISYQITVTNTGNVTLHNVTVTDPLLGMSQNLGTFAPGDSQTILGTYGPVSESDLPGPIINTAIADSDETDPVEDDHRVEILPFGIDLSLTKTVDNVNPEAGELVTFEIVVANGPNFADATGVEVTDTLPAGYAFVGFAVSQGTYAYTGLNSLWIVGDLPAGSSATLHVFATVLEDGPYESPAEVTAANQDDIDSVPANASVMSEDDDDEAVIFIDTPIADLLVIKTVDNANPDEEDTVVFTITVYNGGPYTSTGIVLQDALPAGLTYLSDTSGGTYNPATNTWDVGTLIVGESAFFTLSAQVDIGTAGTTLTNTALVIQNEIDDPSPVNNQASVDVTIGDAPAGGGGAEECEGKVIISEIAWAGTAANPEDEWIELRNVGGEPVDLTGWVLRWRKKQPVTPEDFQWKVVPLSGEIQASAAPICELANRDPEPAVEFVKREVDDLSWFVVARPVDYDESYLILERKSDLTISNVDADIIYDDVAPYLMELSDEGDIIELLDASGVIVDTANAFPSYNGNWPAGDALTLGTMERIDPLGPDERDNWHTNLGIITRGLDANGRPLVASSDVINSQTLEEMELFIELNAARTLPGARLEVGLDLSREVRRETGWPWIRITRPGYDATASAAGGGGGIEPAYSFASRYANDTYWLGIDTGGLVPGDYLVWVVYGEGQTVLVPITVLD